METDSWILSDQALSACKTEHLPKGLLTRIFKSVCCPSYDFYLEYRDDPYLFGVRLVGDDGRAVSFAVVDLAARSEWFSVYLKNR